MCRTQVTRNDVVVFFSLVIGIVNNQSWMNCWMWVKWNRLRVCDTRCDGVRTSWVDCVWFGYGCICSGVMEWLYSEQRPWIELKPGVWMSSLQRFILLDGCVLWTFALFAFFHLVSIPNLIRKFSLFSYTLSILRSPNIQKHCRGIVDCKQKESEWNEQRRRKYNISKWNEIDSDFYVP